MWTIILHTSVATALAGGSSGSGLCPGTPGPRTWGRCFGGLGARAHVRRSLQFKWRCSVLFPCPCGGRTVVVVKLFRGRSSVLPSSDEVIWKINSREEGFWGTFRGGEPKDLFLCSACSSPPLSIYLVPLLSAFGIKMFNFLIIKKSEWGHFFPFSLFFSAER